MDSYGFEDHESRLKKIWFVLSIMNWDLKRFGLYRDHKSSQLSKDSTCFHESNESLLIFSSIARNKSLKIKIPESLWIQILKIQFLDLFQKFFFQSYSISFDSEGFV